MSARFYLGTHEPVWLARTDVPLFVSRRRLARQKSWRRALGPWALDSGGFTELSMHGRWTVELGRYVEEVQLWAEAIGGLEWAAPMDWMCEESIVANTGRSVREHQHLTVANFLELRAALGDVVVPVVQGWSFDDYLACLDLYADAGVDLTRERIVGVGSVCRRDATDEIVWILDTLGNAGLRCHAFGVKGDAYHAVARVVSSTDSMAWSLNARLNPHKKLPECAHPGTCANCMAYALRWRRELLEGTPRPFQPSLFRPKEGTCSTA